MRTAFKRLRRSTVARITLVHLLVLVVTVTSLGAYVYWRVTEQMWQQVDRHIATEVESLAEQYRQRGLNGMLGIIDERIARVPDRRSIYLVEDGFGNWLIGNISAWPSAATKGDGWLTFELYDRATSSMTSARVRTFRLDSGARLLVGRDVQDIHRTTSLIRRALLGGVLFAILLAATVGVLFSRRAWVRLKEINKTSHRVVAGDLQVRVPECQGNSDLDELARNINMMLDEINHLVIGIERVSDNIAHDLRTPLARVRNRLKELEDQSGETGNATIASCRVEIDELIATFNAILRIARLEHYDNPDHKTCCDLDILAANCVALYEPVAEEKQIQMSYLGMQAPVVCDEQLINQAICNLLDNAIKFSPAGGKVDLTLEVSDTRCVLTVCDNGAGISEGDKEKVLQRFYRGESSRRTKGNGLGLSLVSAVAKYHQAELTLGNNFPGLRASLVFPRAEVNLLQAKKVA